MAGKLSLVVHIVTTGLYAVDSQRDPFTTTATPEGRSGLCGEYKDICRHSHPVLQLEIRHYPDGANQVNTFLLDHDSAQNRLHYSVM